MQFSEILADVYDRTGNTAVTAVVTARIKRYVNRWHRKILSSPGMDVARRVTVPVASVVGQPSYGVVLQSIRYMTDATTQRTVHKRTLDWYRERYPDPTRFNGTPEWWVPLGQTRVHTRPSAACELFLVSSEAADTGTAKVEAIRSNGYRVSLSQALTGTTPVSMSATVTDVIDVVDVRLAAAQTGVVTITQGSAGTELTRIPIGQTYPRFLRLALAPTPSQVITYTLDGIADIVDLTNDYDEPLLPIDFHDLLTDGAVYDEWLNRGQTQVAGTILAEIGRRQRELRGAILEWPSETTERPFRTFDETIHLPLT